MPGIERMENPLTVGQPRDKFFPNSKVREGFRERVGRKYESPAATGLPERMKQP
jgi:hypothetical protein